MLYHVKEGARPVWAFALPDNGKPLALAMRQLTESFKFELLEEIAVPTKSSHFNRKRSENLKKEYESMLVFVRRF